MQIVVGIKGKSPLVLHNIRLADDQDPIKREIATLTDKRNKTAADLAEIARLEWYGGLYYAKDFGIYVPTWNILRCLEETAKATRQGKSVIRSVHVGTDRVRLQYDGPANIDDLWEKEEFRFRATVGVQRNKVMRVRPIFRAWGLEFDLELEENEMNPEDLEAILQRAGRIEGLGDARKLGYGRFSVVSVR